MEFLRFRGARVACKGVVLSERWPCWTMAVLFVRGVCGHGVTSVFVDNQVTALEYYTNTLGFEVKNDIPVGEHRWLTVTGRNAPDGAELALEPSEHPAVGPFKEALVADGIPAHSFPVDDLDAEFERLRALGVEFVQEPMPAGPVKMAVLNDTRGNLIQLVELVEKN